MNEEILKGNDILWMEVRVDGEVQRRRVVSKNEVGQPEPETFEGERAIWTLASTVPLIVKT